MKGNARRKGRLIRSAAMVVAVLAVLMPQSPAVGETDRSFDTSGSCTIAVTRVKTDADNVRSHLPKEFRPDVDPAGKATLQIELFECAPFVVDGQDGPVNIGSTVTVFVDAPHNPDVTWGYDLWQVSSRSDFHAVASRLDYRVPLVVDSTFELTRIGAADVVEASIPWSHSRYSLSLTAGDPPPAGIDSRGLHYHLGRHGLIQIEYPLENFAINGGIATVTADPGSPLAQILGADSVTSAGALITLDFLGKHGLIPFPE